MDKIVIKIALLIMEIYRKIMELFSFEFLLESCGKSILIRFHTVCFQSKRSLEFILNIWSRRNKTTFSGRRNIGRISINNLNFNP